MGGVTETCGISEEGEGEAVYGEFESDAEGETLMTTVKRTSDRLKIDPDHIQVELDGADPAAEIAAVWESIRSFSSDARLSRLEVFDELRSVAERLRAELAACDGHATDNWRWRLAEAEKYAARLHLKSDALRGLALRKVQNDKIRTIRKSTT